MKHKVTASVKRDAVNWANSPRLFTHAEFCRKHKVGANTGYRLLASALAETIRN